MVVMNVQSFALQPLLASGLRVGFLVVVGSLVGGLVVANVGRPVVGSGVGAVGLGVTICVGGPVGRSVGPAAGLPVGLAVVGG